VIASDVGGIPEVVADGTTGLLVHYDAADHASFEREFAAAVNQLIENSEMATAMGIAGRARAVEYFGWDAIAEQTMDVYRAAMSAN
jgi:starch synthase